MTSPPRRYPGYDVLDKWNSASWDDITRDVVGRRLHEVPRRRFFDPGEWVTLQALCDTVLPQPERADPIPIAPFIDAVMAENRTSGTRYAELPPMRQAWRRGLAALDAEARCRTGRAFAELARDDREAVLKKLDEEDVQAPDWQDLPSRRLFREIFAKEIVRTYYGHPTAWSEIGFGGPASPRGYVRLSANRRDRWEASEAEEDPK